MSLISMVTFEVVQHPFVVVLGCDRPKLQIYIASCCGSAWGGGGGGDSRCV